MHGLLQDLQYAWRALRRRPGFTAIAIGTLALGIGANATIFTFVYGLLLRPLPFPDAERLVQIRAIRGQESGKLMAREWEELDREPNLFDGVAGYYLTQYNIAEGGAPLAARTTMTTASLFRVLGVKFAAGGSWPEGSHRVRTPSVVLTHALWAQRFGSNPAIVGKSVLLDGVPYQVAGVTAAGFQYPAQQELLRPGWLYHEQNRYTRSLFALAKLKPGVTFGEAQGRLNAFSARMEHEFPETNRALRFELAPLRDHFVGEVRPFLLLSWLLVGVVLLIACANLGNLLLARAIERQREVAVRLALGANQARILQQLLAEALVLSALGAIGGGLLSIWWSNLLRAWMPLPFPAWMTLESGLPVFGLCAGLAILTALLTAAMPYFMTADQSLLATFQDASRGSSSGRRQRWARDLLMAGELGLCVVLLITSGLLLRSFTRLLDTDPGFRRETLLTLRVDPPFSKYSHVDQTALFYREAERLLSELPGVQSVTANHSLPFGGNDNYGKPGVVLEGQSEAERLHNPFVNAQVVSPNYLRTMNIPIYRGRDFGSQDRAGAPLAAILSRPLAQRLFGEQEAVGRRFRFIGLMGSTDNRQDDWFTVIGVCNGALTEGLLGKPGLDVYLSNQQQFVGDTYFVLRTTGDPATLAPALPKTFARLDAEQAIFDIATMDERVDLSVWQRRLAAGASACFGVVALLLATLGAYGVISYSVARRKRELGVRLALGATPAAVTRMVIAQGMCVASYGLAAGTLAAAVLAFLIRPMLHGIHFLDPATFTLVTGGLAAVSLAACYVPARRAAGVDPLAALREE